MLVDFAGEELLAIVMVPTYHTVGIGRNCCLPEAGDCDKLTVHLASHSDSVCSFDTSSATSMEAGDAAQDRFLLAICPQCHEPLYPRRELAGKTAPCPACGATVPVPHEEPLPEPTGDEYS